MTGIRRAGARVSALAGVLATLAAAGIAATIPDRTVPAPVRAAEDGPASSGRKGLRAALPGTGGKARLTVGLAGHSLFYLPIYMADEHTAQNEDLSLQVVSFRGGSQVAAALASGSVDIAAASLNVVIGTINAGQSVKAFYVTSPHAAYEWFARPAIRGWGDLRGKAVAISAYGSLSDFLTRHVMRLRGLAAGQDVHVVQAGETAERFAALKAGRVDAAILLPPFTWYAEGLGFRRLGSEATDVAQGWPHHVAFAKEKVLAEHPYTLHAFLRAHVKAIRLARADREAAVRVLIRRLKYERRYAERAYAEVMAGFDERGALPIKAMPVFWEIAMAAGEAKEPWPESRFLDRQFIDTFEEWAPR